MALTTLTKIGKGITSFFKARGATHARELSDRFSEVYYAEDYGCTPVDIVSTDYFNLDFSRPYIGVDSTAEFKNLLSIVQDKCRVHSTTAYQRRGVIDLGGKTYIVSGENPLGNQLTTGMTGSPYYYKIQNGQILWNRGAGYSCFSGFTLHNCDTLDLENIRLFGLDNSSTSGSFFRFGEPNENPKIGGGTFKGCDFICSRSDVDQGIGLENVFQMNGNTLADRFTIKDCNIGGFVNLWSCNNPEAVSWYFGNCSITTSRANARFFHHSVKWSGSMHIIGCDIISLGDNTTVFSSRGLLPSEFTQRSISIDSRFEMRGDNVNWFDVQTNSYVVTNMDMAAGSGNKINHKILLGLGSSLQFTNSTICQNIDLGSWQGEEPIASFRRMRCINCTFRGGYPIPTYGGISSIRGVVEGGYKTGILEVSDSSETVNGIWGVSNDRYSLSKERTIRIGYTDSQGYNRIDKEVEVPFNIIITSIKYYLGYDANAKGLSLYGNGNKLITVSTPSTPAGMKGDMIPSDKLGLYYIKDSNDWLRLRLKVLDLNGDPIDPSTSIGFADVTFRPIESRKDYNNSSSPTNAGLVNL